MEMLWKVGDTKEWKGLFSLFGNTKHWPYNSLYSPEPSLKCEQFVYAGSSSSRLVYIDSNAWRLFAGTVQQAPSFLIQTDGWSQTQGQWWGSNQPSVNQHFLREIRWIDTGRRKAKQARSTAWTSLTHPLQHPLSYTLWLHVTDSTSVLHK